MTVFHTVTRAISAETATLSCVLPLTYTLSCKCEEFQWQLACGKIYGIGRFLSEIQKHCNCLDKKQHKRKELVDWLVLSCCYLQTWFHSTDKCSNDTERHDYKTHHNYSTALRLKVIVNKYKYRLVRQCTAWIVWKRIIEKSKFNCNSDVSS